MPAVSTSFDSPDAPSSSMRFLGTMKRLMPLTPGGAPSIFARVGWMMLSVMSWSPEEMKRFVPRMR